MIDHEVDRAFIICNEDAPLLRSGDRCIEHLVAKQTAFLLFKDRNNDRIIFRTLTLVNRHCIGKRNRAKIRLVINKRYSVFPNDLHFHLPFFRIEVDIDDRSDITITDEFGVFPHHHPIADPEGRVSVLIRNGVR